MATGLLEVSGTLGVNQFWPNGGSDGDTAKVVVGAGAFRFRAKPNGKWKVTNAFDHAIVKRSLNSKSAGAVAGGVLKALTGHNGMVRARP